MLRLSIAYAKKVPASQEFSSQSYHCSVEIELPNMSKEELQSHIRDQYAIVRESVDAEITNNSANTTPIARQLPSRDNTGSSRANGNGGRNPNEPASNKQIAFLTDSLRRQGYDISATCANYGVSSLYDLTKAQASQILDGLQQQKAA